MKLLPAVSLALASWGFSALAAAQSPSAGSVVGRVLDAGSGRPVTAALVALEPAVSGLIVDPRSSTSLVGVRSVVTGDDGAYRFADVAPARYRLRIERLGYRAATLEVEVRRPVEAAVSIGLELDPVALEPVRVDQRAAALFQRSANRSTDLDEARRASERLRQALFIAPDARMLTYADVMDGVTLGEGDVFRALQRFPGVGTRDDYTAELWTRGAPWTQTRVTFDGVPLFNPVHAVGVLSAITPEVLGSVFFHPGVRPASVAEGAAGTVDLRSRAGGGTGQLRGVADVSMASAKLVLDQRVGRAAWIVAARRSHLDVLSGSLGSLGLDTLDLPYVFGDIAGRADLDLGPRTHIEASGLWEQDRIQGDVEGVLERTNARWGNTAGRVTLSTQLGDLEITHTLGASRFSARTDERVVRVRAPAPIWTEPASRNEIRYTHVTGQLAPIVKNEATPWSLGYDVAWQRGSYDGPLPRYYAVKPDTVARLTYERALRVLAVWGEARIALGEHVTLNPGMRVESSDEFSNAPAIRASPRLAARLTLSQDHAISIALGRSWQYVQAIALAGPSIHPAFHASHFWVWPDARTPAIRADVASIGSEHWLGDGWLASATVYARRASGVGMPDPTPGRLGRRPLFVSSDGKAHGIEANLRRIGAQWSAALGYTHGVSNVDIAGNTSPSPADRRHLFDAMLSVRVLQSVRIAGAYTAMSGAPFTRAYSRSPQDCTAFGFGCDNPFGSFIEEPNAERTPPYGSLDASVQWSRALQWLELSAYVQVRNVLGRDNASTYAGSVPIARTTTRTGTQIVFDDRFESGLARLPLVGLRVTF